MKKLCCILAVLVFVFVFVPVSASKVKYEFSISSDDVCGNREARVTLSAETNPGMTAGELNIKYDRSALAFSRYEVVEGFPCDVVAVKDNKYGQVKFVFADTKGMIVYTGGMVRLYFTPLTADAESTVSLDLAEHSVYDDDYASAEYTCKNGTVRYFRSLLGDVDGDGRITPSDYIMLRLHMISIITLEGKNLLFGDINGDGVVTPTDYIQLRLHLLGVININ